MREREREREGSKRGATAEGTSFVGKVGKPDLSGQ